MPAPAAYCPDPSVIPAISEVTRLSPEKSQEERQREREEDREADRAREEAWRRGIPQVTEEEGYAAFQRDYERADPQQRMFIDACGETDEHGHRVIQGVACAGSGKTFSLVLGVAKVYYKRKIPAQQIVVTTFTRKASEELQERLCKYIPKHIVFTLMRVGTFHSGRVSGQGLRNANAGFRGMSLIRDLSGILRSILGRMPPNGTPYVGNVEGVEYRDIADKVGGLQKGAKAYSDLITNKFEPWGVNSPDEVRAYLGSVKDPDALERSERERYDNILKAKNLSADEDTYPFFAGIWRDALRVKEARKEYTFNDMLAMYLSVASRDRASLFIVDEGQDNSWTQMQIAQRVSKASGGTLLFVGDGRQAIYAFRAADATIFQFAAEDLGAVRKEIGTNYRSGYWIVEAGNEVCLDEHRKVYPWAVGEPAVTGRRNADGSPVQGLISVAHYDPKTKAVTGAVAAREEWETNTEASERRGGKKTKKVGGRVQIAGEVPAAREVGQQMADAIQAGRRAGDFAVLTRTNAALGPFELALARFRIPVVYAGSKVNFMSRPAITRMLRLLALCAPGVVEDPQMAGRMLQAVLKDDGGMWYGNRFRFMANADFFAVVQQNWSRGILSTVEALGRIKNGKWRRGTEDIAAELAPLVEDSGWPDAATLAAEVLRGWEKLQREDGEDDLDDSEPDEDAEDSYYQSLADIGATFETYAEFMAYVAKARTTQVKGEDEKIEGGSCVLSTAHRSKGLQFEVVYVIANHGIWPHSRATSEKDLAEERRLYYVAITRAVNELHVWSTGEGSSPFTIEVFQNKIFPRMEAARIEAERAKRLTEVEIKELGSDTWGVFRNGVRLALQGVSTFTSYDAAATAYLAPHDEAEAPEAPFANQIRVFLDWLQDRAPDVVSRLRANPNHVQLLESLFADGAVSKVLGWSMLADLFPEQPGDVEILTLDHKRLGYLLRGSPRPFEIPAVYYGYLELRAPFTDYVVRPISSDDDPTTYGTRFEDYSPSLLEARYAYATLLPEDRRALGAAVPLDTPQLLDMPLVDFGPTAAQVVAGPIEAEVIAEISTTPLEATLPKEGASSPPETLDPRSTPRRMLPFKVPEDRGWSLIVVNSTWLILGIFALYRYKEFPVLERAVLRHTSEDGVTSIYRAMAGGVDKLGRVMAEIQLIAGGPGDPSFKISKFDLRPLGQDTLDAGLQTFLSNPHIEGADQVLWEASLGRAFLVDLGRFTDINGMPLIPFGAGGWSGIERRLVGSGWFTVERQSGSSQIHWNMEKVRQIYGEGTWLG